MANKFKQAESKGKVRPSATQETVRNAPERPVIEEKVEGGVAVPQEVKSQPAAKTDDFRPIWDAKIPDKEESKSYAVYLPKTLMDKHKKAAKKKGVSVSKLLALILEDVYRDF